MLGPHHSNQPGLCGKTGPGCRGPAQGLAGVGSRARGLGPPELPPLWDGICFASDTVPSPLSQAWGAGILKCPAHSAPHQLSGTPREEIQCLAPPVISTHFLLPLPQITVNVHLFA